MNRRSLSFPLGLLVGLAVATGVLLYVLGIW